jgi:hypothetical protein
MDISAKAADPDSQNGERESMLAIAKVGIFFRLFRQLWRSQNVEERFNESVEIGPAICEAG